MKLDPFFERNFSKNLVARHLQKKPHFIDILFKKKAKKINQKWFFRRFLEKDSPTFF